MTLFKRLKQGILLVSNIDPEKLIPMFPRFDKTFDMVQCKNPLEILENIYLHWKDIKAFRNF